MITVSGAITKLDAKYTPKGIAVLTLTLSGRFNRRIGNVRTKFLGAYAERLMGEVAEGNQILVVGEVDGYSNEKGTRLEVLGRSLAPAYGQVAHSQYGAYLENATNEVEIYGRLGADPESRRFRREDGSEGLVTTARIALYRGKEKAPLWVRVKAWDAVAETLGAYRKGQLLVVRGALLRESWEQDGEKRYREIIEAKEILTGKPQ